MVLTYVCDLPVLTEECVVYRHHRTLLWIDYNIIDTIFCQQGGSISCSRINSLDLRFALTRINPMCPDVAGIAHDGSASGQKDWRVVNRRVQHRRARRCGLLYHFSKGHSVAIEFLELTLSGDDCKYIQGAGPSQHHEKYRRADAHPRRSFPKARQQQRYQGRRSNPPIEENFYVVPNPWGQLHHVWHDETERER